MEITPNDTWSALWRFELCYNTSAMLWPELFSAAMGAQGGGEGADADGREESYCSKPTRIPRALKYGFASK